MHSVMEMDREQFKTAIREEISTFFNEKITSLPIFQLSERILRVEEELKHLGKRFEDMLHHTDKRFDQVYKHFEQVDKRFEQVDKRFEQVDKRFEQVDKRFEQVDKRFDLVDTQFRILEKRIGFISWFIPAILTTVIMITPLLYKAIS